MHHCLLVASLIIAKLGHLLQRLANSGDIAVAKDTKASGEKGLFSPVAFHVLVFEKCNNSLRHRQTFCCLFDHKNSVLDTHQPSGGGRKERLRSREPASQACSLDIYLSLLYIDTT